MSPLIDSLSFSQIPSDISSRTELYVILYSDEIYNIDRLGAVIRPSIPYEEVSPVVLVLILSPVVLVLILSPLVLCPRS